MTNWFPIVTPGIHGFYTPVAGHQGLEVEVVQAYEGCWYLFMTRLGVPVACSIEAHGKESPNGFLSFTEAKQIGTRIAKQLMK